MYKFDYIPKQESDINDSLINLYGSHLLALYAALKPIYDGKDYAVKPALPFLLWPKNNGNDWTNADLKVMIYGRETNGWDNPDSRERKMEPNWALHNSDDVRNEIDAIQNIYDGYFNFTTKQEQEENNKFFKCGLYPIVESIKLALPSIKVSYLWNEISKIGNGYNIHKDKVSCGKPKTYIHDIEMKHFNVSQGEIDILKPDVIIFLAGKDATPYILEKFNIITSHAPSLEFPEISEITISNVKYVLKTNFNHPSRGLSKETRDKNYPEIVRRIKQQFGL